MKKILITLSTIGLLSLNSNHLNAQKMIEITKSVVINSTLQKTFNKVLFLEEFPDWSPFLEEDPSQTYEVKGEDGKVGAQYHWYGNKGKDQGYQEIVAIDNNQSVTMNCNITAPFEAKPTFNYSFRDTGNGIEVTQRFQLAVSGVSNFIMGLFGVKKKMAETNARGLELLKESVEGKVEK